MSNTVLEEKAEHRRAFEIYYAMGEERGLRPVAKQLNRSLTTIHNWSKAFDWKERIEIRDTMIAQQTEKKVVETVVEIKANYHKILKAAIYQFVEDFKSGKIKINSIHELERAMRLDLELLGEEDRKQNKMMDDLSQAIQASMELFQQSGSIEEKTEDSEE